MVGRPKHKATDQNRKLVKILSAGGMTQEDVAAELGIHFQTLVKYYREEYESGSRMIVAELLPVSLKVAKDIDHKDSAAERRFLLERKGGFIKTEKQEISGTLKPFEVIVQSVDAEPQKED